MGVKNIPGSCASYERRLKGKEGGARGETSGLHKMDLKWDIVLVTLILTSLAIQRVTKIKSI